MGKFINYKMGCTSSTPIHPKQAYDGTKDHALEANRTASKLTQNLIRENSTSVQVDDVYTVKWGNKDALGSGATSTVRICTHKTNLNVFALKTIALNRLQKEEREILRKEVEIMKQLDHPNIIKLIETFHTHACLHIVMECCSGGELFDRLVDTKTPHKGRFTEQVAQQYTLQITSSLKYLHDNNIIHRDLKLENFLLTSKNQETAELKMIDFGMSRHFLEGEKFTQTCGTVYYMAPEVVDRSVPYTEASDMWSLGVIVYAFLCGSLPFGGFGMRDSEILQLVMKGKCDMTSSIWKKGNISEEAKDFVASLLIYDPTKRMSATDALKHSFLTNTTTTTTTNQNQNEGKEDKVENGGQDTSSLPLSALKKFREYTLFKRAVLSVIAFNLSENDIQQMKETFSQFDIEKNGVVKFNEFTKIMHAHGVLKNDELDQMFQALDVDQTGVIKYSEFLAACVDEKVYLSEKRMLDAYNTLDVDQTGHLSRDNFRNFVGKDTIDEKMFNEMFDEIDTAGDGVISLTEFKAMLLKKTTV